MAVIRMCACMLPLRCPPCPSTIVQFLSLSVVSPSAGASTTAQMRGRLRHRRAFSRRKLDFGDHQVPKPSALDDGVLQLTNKRRRKTAIATPKASFIAETSSDGYGSLSTGKDAADCSKLPATYRRRRQKAIQKCEEARYDNEHGLALVSVQEGVSGVLNGASKGSSGDLDVFHPKNGTRMLDMAPVAQRSRVFNVTQNSTASDMSTKSDSSRVADVVPHTQCYRVLDMAPLARTSSVLDVAPLDSGSLAQAIDTAILYQGPYPSFTRPSAEECSEVRDRLWQLHGPLEEYAKHRIARNSDSQVLALEYHKDKGSSTARDSEGSKALVSREAAPSSHPRERRTVLDALVGTILSQNTTDTNSRRAFASLKSSFPTWEGVYGADPKAVEDAIRCGGLAEIKASRILNILSILHHEKGELCLEYVRNMSTDEIKLELSRFKGVGPKTVACVLMFHLQQNEFPVDTHVFRISKMLGWVPPKADREKAYHHLNHRIPNDLKFDLHCLLVTHGKRCPRCAKGGRTQKSADGPCPLVSLSSRLLESSPCDIMSIDPPEDLHENP